MKFQLDQGHFKKFRNDLIIKLTPLLLLPLVAILIVSDPIETSTLLLIPIFLIIIISVLYNSIKKQKKAWETFELTIYESTVERVQEGFPSIYVSKNDIIEALETPNGSITLITNPKSNSIIIPFSVRNKIQLIETISSFTPLRRAENSNPIFLIYGSGLLGIFLFLSVMLSTNFYLTIVSGSILIIILCWAFIEIQRNKNIENRVKRSSYIGIILLVVVVYKLYVTLS